MNKFILVALSIFIISQAAYAASSKNRGLEEVKAYFQKCAAAEGTWKNFINDFEKGKEVSNYKGKEVLFRGSMWSRNNLIQVKIPHSGIFCLVSLRDDEVKSVAQYPADSCEVEVRGIIHSIDMKKKQIEVSSIETTVTAAQ